MILRTKQLVIDYQRTFATVEGKRVLEDLRKRAPLLTDSIQLSGGIDPNKLIFLEGQRSVLVYIYKMLNRDPNMELPERAISKGE